MNSALGSSVKLLIKKNGSVKQLVGGQAVKISKDQIQIKNNSNYNSQGSNSAANPQSNQRSRSLSNSKFVKKKSNAQVLVSAPEII